MSSVSWELLATWIGIIVTAAIGLYNLRANRRKTDAETADTKADTALKSREAAAFDEDREDRREEKWQNKLAECEQKFEAQLAPMRTEIATLRRYIETHVPWDWKAVRELRLKGVEIEDPPTLVYLPPKDQP